MLHLSLRTTLFAFLLRYTILSWICVNSKSFLTYFSVLIAEPIENENDLQFKTLKITDFGLAREAYKTTRMSAAGTYAWMAPEVIQEIGYDCVADIWSLGESFNPF